MKLFAQLGRMTLNQKLAALLLVLGFLAVFLGDPYRRAKAAIDAKELALIVEKQVDHVTAEELADWIIQGRADYRLIDLRSEAEYAAYHIPTAENIPLTELPNAELMRNEKIVLYSEGGIHSAQAWFLLRAKGYKAVYMLFGGLEEWKDKILFPVIPADVPPAEEKRYAKMAEISRFFGGTPQTSGEAMTQRPNVNLPAPAPVAAPSAAPKPQGKKKKEGC
ncbi:MAG: rhodanese-like domain-containing protein [candidate division KSB1 bacterium]|nr:rhodanese-like domain-containing protein [candidate division KSB1 bacterium]